MTTWHRRATAKVEVTPQTKYEMKRERKKLMKREYRVLTVPALISFDMKKQRMVSNE